MKLVPVREETPRDDPRSNRVLRAKRISGGVPRVIKTDKRGLPSLQGPFEYLSTFGAEQSL